MGKSILLLGAVLSLSLGSVTARGVDSEPITVKTWHHGESIDGEEFTAATEQIVDYLATLKHPDGLLDQIVYHCTGKVRELQLSVQNTGTTQGGWVYSTMVYELKDCAEAK